MTKPLDTIAAIATASGGGVGIIRLSGPEALRIATRHATGLPEVLRPRHAYHVWWHGEEGALDEGLLIFMRGPKSFTGEDVVELQLHGGALSLRRCVEVCWRSGARPALAGEFSRRAFLNGRLDLTRAEAIADLVSAQTDRALDQARVHLLGGLYQQCQRFRDDILRVRAQLEVAIDFIEDEVPVIDTEALSIEIDTLANALEALAETYHQGKLIRDGATVVLIGPPNAGKSSLFNALCEADRAIVTARPGTTRDTLEATIDILGVPITLIDTAGIRDTDDEIEAAGIARTHRAVAKADLVIALLDPESPDLSEHPDAVHVISKSDVTTTQQLAGTLSISATTGEGLKHFKRSIVQHLGASPHPGQSSLMIGRQRHYAALVSASEALRQAQGGLRHDAPPELCAVDVQEATDRLAEIVGLTTIEDMLDVLFGAFCIGK